MLATYLERIKTFHKQSLQDLEGITVDINQGLRHIVVNEEVNYRPITG